ncbi:class I SAM-dependent methyltransferase [Streptomyces sp. B6B3]|uniref:class I SAM-dependent methyltransferase n=1 Tax=Streptomyces sp. B6B3 TaxID=3153570 RepID=UPI00325C8A8C
MSAAHRVDFDRRLHAVYARGRALPAETMAEWMRVFAGHAPRRPAVVLDLGSGTGRFTPALAEAFGGPVHGVEPSARMRAVAEESAAHPAVAYRHGSAEDIPLPDGSCDLALMFFVLHHVRDRPAAAAEIARVLRPDGRLLIRSWFTDRMPDLLWHRYFPRAREIELGVFPALSDVLDVFGAVGLRRIAFERVRLTLTPSLAAYADRLRQRAGSTFELLTEAEITAGQAALDAAAAAETTPTPVVEDCELLVLGR